MNTARLNQNRIFCFLKTIMALLVGELINIAKVSRQRSSLILPASDHLAPNTNLNSSSPKKNITAVGSNPAQNNNFHDFTMDAVIFSLLLYAAEIF